MLFCLGNEKVSKKIYTWCLKTNRHYAPQPQSNKCAFNRWLKCGGGGVGLPSHYNVSNKRKQLWQASATNLLNIYSWNVSIILNLRMCLLYLLPVTESLLVLLFSLNNTQAQTSWSDCRPPWNVLMWFKVCCWPHSQTADCAVYPLYTGMCLKDNWSHSCLRNIFHNYIF